MDELTRSNVEMAEELGLLDVYKIDCGAPLNYKFIDYIEANALDEAGIKYYKRATFPEGPVFIGFVHPDVYKLIRLYEKLPGFADMTLAEFLKKSYTEIINK